MVTRSNRKVKRRRPLKHHVQQELRLKLDKNGQRRGGKRRGAGRKPTSPGRPGASHLRRPTVDGTKPLHITLRVLDDVSHLRKPKMFRAIRRALVVTAGRTDFRIVHYSVQGNHIHLICEADSNAALAAGMRSFEISAAKQLNAEMTRQRGRRRSGRVFADRYNVVVIDSVAQTRHTLSYVLNNWRHHTGDRGPVLFDGKLDPYSSAVLFPGWRERTTPEIHIPADYEAPVVCRPRSWLLAEGWKRAQTPISCYEVPG